MHGPNPTESGHVLLFPFLVKSWSILNLFLGSKMVHKPPGP